MRQGSSTLYFLLGDHLGSTAITANSNGALYTEQRYYPWGDTRYNSPTTTPTAYQYTGQRKDATGLYFYNARYYDPYLNRFISPDTIIPDPANPQSLNRYSYVLNNPLKYVDPMGHWWEDPETGALMPGYGPLSMPESWEVGKGTYNDIEPLKVYSCGTLPECHGTERRNARGVGIDGGYADFQDQDQIQRNDFNALLEAVYQDLDRESTIRVHLEFGLMGYFPAAAAGRGQYDTPFWNAGEDDINVCVDGHQCSTRSEVNYFAQGMWGAAAGETLDETLEVANYWNEHQYGHPATTGELYWTKFGWTWYNRRARYEDGTHIQTRQ